MADEREAVTGRFAFDVATGDWQWDAETYRIHGLAPTSAEPTLQTVLDAADPDAATRIKDALDAMIATADPFSIAYQLTGADDVERSVVLVGQRAVCDPDDVTTLEGYFIDLTDDLDAVARDAAQAAVEASAEHRAVIEQAKGALMMVYGFGPDAAFSMLRWWSRSRNVKIRDLAGDLMRASQDGEVSIPAFRGSVDRLLHDLTDREPAD